MRIVGGDWIATVRRLYSRAWKESTTAMRAFWIFALAAIAAPVLAQDGSPAANAPAPTALQPAPIDEVIVPGRTGEQLRVEIERLETAVYDRFNTLNSDDEFDIHCFEQAPTGSNIPVRKCWPNFALDAEKRAASKALRRMQGTGGGSGGSASERLTNEEKSKQLIAEIQRVARQDEQLARDLTRLAELKESQQSGRERRAGR
jgi:hypothetical protein